jgi:hypothetical protein
LGLELPPGVNLFQEGIAGSLTSATGRGMLLGGHPCHSSTWLYAPPWRSRVWQNRSHSSDKAIADSHTRRSLSGSLAEVGGSFLTGDGGEPRSSGFILQVCNVAPVIESAGEPSSCSRVLNLRHLRPHWVGSKERLRSRSFDETDSSRRVSWNPESLRRVDATS